MTVELPTTISLSEPTFEITIDEAKALNFFLQIHGILLKDNPDEYLQILRLINGIPQFLDKHGK